MIKLDLETYRGNTTAHRFEDMPRDLTSAQVKIEVRFNPNDVDPVISKEIFSTDEGNDWGNGIVQVNLSEGDTFYLNEKIYFYDLTVIYPTFPEVVTEYYGLFNLILSITRGSAVIDVITESDIYANFASDQVNKGASLIGVLASFWDSAIGATYDTVEKVLQWLYSNKAGKTGSFTDNKVLRSDSTTGTIQTSGVTLDDSNNITGVNDLDVGGNLTVTGDLTVQGTTTTINTQDLEVEDKNIIIGNVGAPTDTTADGGGWTLKGLTDKLFRWIQSTGSWTSSENIDLASGKKYLINNTDVLAQKTGTFTDNKILRSDSTTGTVKTSPVTMDDTGNISGAGDYSGTTGTFSDNVSVASGKEFRRDGSEYVDTIIKTILTTSGDLLIKSGSALARLAIGSAGYVLGITAGLPAWVDLNVAISTYLLTVLTTNGDLLTRSSGALARIAAGTNGYVLTMVAGAPAWESLSTSGFLPTSGGTMTGDIVDLSVPDGAASTPSVKVGGEQNGLYSGAANLLGLATNGVGRFTLDGNGQIQAVINSTIGTDYTSTLYDGFLCRAWGAFDGTGTPTFSGAGNFSSITDNGTGYYTCNFTTSLPDTSYAVVIHPNINNNYCFFLGNNFSKATGSVTFRTGAWSGSSTADAVAADPENCSVAIFR